MSTQPSEQKTRPLALVILDGLGLRAETEGNAFALANTPTLDRLMQSCPTATLKTCGKDVGLPDGQMGNSEVGHTNIGAGRVVCMDLPRIDNAMEDRSFDKMPAVVAHIEALKASGGSAHLLGVLSPGGVHAHQRHMAYVTKLFAAADIPVKLHFFTDGRDVAPKSAMECLAALHAQLVDAPGAKMSAATVSGRYYAMDRDNRWERVALAHAAMIDGKGESAASVKDAIETAYAADLTDEFILPTVIDGFDGMKDGDGLFCLNFRSDRAREILAAMLDPAFDAFERRSVAFADALGMVEYSSAHNAYLRTVMPAQQISDGLGETLAKAGLTQLRLAETEKYPHVTFFFNGGEETPSEGEDRSMAPSPKVATYDLQPEMAAEDVTNRFIETIEAGKTDVFIVNYANPDMVGHTGDLGAAIKSVEAVDSGLGRVVEAMERAGGRMLIFADHGNCEMMIDPQSGGPHTAHTLNEVPLILVGEDSALQQGGRLADVAPTALALLGVDQPAAMTGQSLLVV